MNGSRQKRLEKAISVMMALVPTLTSEEFTTLCDAVKHAYSLRAAEVVLDGSDKELLWNCLRSHALNEYPPKPMVMEEQTKKPVDATDGMKNGVEEITDEKIVATFRELTMYALNSMLYGTIDFTTDMMREIRMNVRALNLLNSERDSGN